MHVNEEVVIWKRCHLNVSSDLVTDLSDHIGVTLHTAISCKTERREHNQSNKKAPVMQINQKINWKKCDRQ